MFWTPSIAVSGMTFYTGDKFPVWKGNVFVGSLQTGEIPGTGHLERIVFNEKSEELRGNGCSSSSTNAFVTSGKGRTASCTVITDADAGALIRLEPVEEASGQSPVMRARLGGRTAFRSTRAIRGKRTLIPYF